MNTSKLEYLIKNLPMQQKGNILVAMDPNGEYEFDFMTQDFLKSPDTDDPFVLIAVPNYMDPACIAAYIEKYVQIFKNINAMCLEYKIRPFFDNPEDVKASELTREDLCKQEHDSVIARFFGVQSYYDYTPIPYEPTENK